MRPTVKLGELYDITSSKRVFEKDWKKSGVPFYRAREIVKLSENGYVDNELFISEEMYKEYGEKYGLPKKNDIMVTGVGTIGICYLVKDNDKFYFKDGNILRFKNKGKDVNSRFVEYFFKTDLLKNQIQSFGSVVQTLTIQKAKEVEIPLPPLETQKVIVAKLDQIFAELDQTKSEIQKNLDNTDELWKSALNQAFQGDWEMKKLGEVCDKITDGSHNPPKGIENSDYIMISSRNIDEGKIIFDDVRYLEKQDFDLEDKRTNVKEGDVLLSIVGTIGKVCVVKKEYGKFTMQRSVAVVKPLENKLYSYYLSYFLQAPLFQNVINENARGVAQKGIYLNSVKSLQIPVPPLSEQEKIVEHLDQVSKEVKALKSQYQSQLDNLEELKKSVLDKAFRGELGE